MATLSSSAGFDGFKASLTAIGSLGFDAITVLLVGGALLALPFTALSYYYTLKLFTRLRNKRLKKWSRAKSLMNRTDIKKILQANELAPKKKLGQNFLVHQATAERIVELAEVGPADTIIEIGVGLGSLTLPLCQRAGRVIGIEFDSGIVKYHQNNKSLPENTQIIHQDILKTDFAQLAREHGSPLKIIANLPYSISNPCSLNFCNTGILWPGLCSCCKRRWECASVRRPAPRSMGCFPSFSANAPLLKT